MIKIFIIFYKIFIINIINIINKKYVNIMKYNII